MMAKAKPRPSLAERVKQGLQEAIDHERGEGTLRIREVVKEVRSDERAG